MGRADRAGDQARRRGLRPRRSRCRRASPKAASSSRSIPRRRSIYLPGGKVPEAGRSLRQQGLRQHAARASPRTAPRRSIAARSRARLPPTCEDNGGIITLRRSRAVPRDRARAGRRPVSRPHAVCRRPAGLDRHSAVRVAADPRELSAAAGRAHDHRRRLLPLPARSVEGARPDAARRRPRALAGRLRRAPHARAREEAVRRRSIRRRRHATSGRRRTTRRSRRRRASAPGRRRLRSPMPTAT